MPVQNKYAVKLFQPSIASWAASGADSLLSVADGYSDGGYVLLVKGSWPFLGPNELIINPIIQQAPQTFCSLVARPTSNPI